MPKGENPNRRSRTILTSEIPSPYQYSETTPTMQSSMQAQSMSHPHTSPYATGGPVQPLQYPQLSQPAPLPVRASSGAWTPADDTTLMAARAQGLNWQPIQANYFPTKTPNACRKRHERLMDRRNSDDWDVIKLENLAKEYMNMRKDIWSQLGAKTGEKWAVVEAKCMSSGIKNLQSAARACARRERLENPSGISGGGSSGLLAVHHAQHHNDGAYGDHTDDSAIGLEELDAEYSPGPGSYEQSSLSPEEESRNGGGGVVRAYPGVGGGRGYGLPQQQLQHQHQHHHHQGQQQQMMQDPRRDRGDGRGGYVQHGLGQGGMHPQQYGLQQRLPSIDMGIGAIINRPHGGL